MKKIYDIDQLRVTDNLKKYGPITICLTASSNLIKPNIDAIRFNIQNLNSYIDKVRPDKDLHDHTPDNKLTKEDLETMNKYIIDIYEYASSVQEHIWKIQFECKAINKKILIHSKED